MSDIIVKFKPMGQKQLIDAINRLEAAQGKATTTAKQHRLAIGRNRQAMGMFEQSLATVRSRLLVFNFAMSMGLRQLMQFSREAARVEDMSRAFTTLSGTGENASIAVNKISRAVKGTMSQMDLFKQANNAMILGVTRNTDEMSEMFQIAQTLGAALGVDTAQAVESLITGIGRQSRLMLDNIGIIVKSDEAYKKYAESLGITADKLTDAQKKQAFFTATMESARAKAAELGNQQLTARDQFNQFNATMEDFTNFIGDKTTPIVLSFFDSFAETLRQIMETDIQTAVRQLQDLSVEAEKLSIFNKIFQEVEAREQIKKSEKIIIDGFEDIALQLQDDPIGGFSFLTSETLDKMIVDLEKFGLDVEKNMVGAGRAGALMADGLKIDIEDLNIDIVNQKIKDIEFQAKALREVLKLEPDNEFFLSQVKEASNLHSVYSLILEEYNKMIEAQKTLGINTDDITVKFGLNRLEMEKLEPVQTRRNNSIEMEKELLDDKLDMYSVVAKATANLVAVGGKNALISARIQQIAAIIDTFRAANAVVLDPFNMARVIATGLANVAVIESSIGKMNSVAGASVTGQFEQGGLVGGRRHSQGGTIIEAERGEFVMSRNAVESIGLETLNQLNSGAGGAGNVIVNVSGNVMTQDFVEGELAESIKEAVRRGSDFGIG